MLIATKKLLLIAPVVPPIAAERRPEFVGRCALCGDPCQKASDYCRAHAWAVTR